MSSIFTGRLPSSMSNTLSVSNHEMDKKSNFWEFSRHFWTKNPTKTKETFQRQSTFWQWAGFWLGFEAFLNFVYHAQYAWPISFSKFQTHFYLASQRICKTKSRFFDGFWQTEFLHLIKHQKYYKINQSDEKSEWPSTVRGHLKKGHLRSFSNFEPV